MRVERKKIALKNGLKKAQVLLPLTDFLWFFCLDSVVFLFSDRSPVIEHYKPAVACLDLLGRTFGQGQESFSRFSVVEKLRGGRSFDCPFPARSFFLKLYGRIPAGADG